MKNIVLAILLFVVSSVFSKAQDFGPRGEISKSGDWVVKVVLKNNSDIQGVVLGDRFIEAITYGGIYEETDNFRTKGAGIRLWYVRNSPGFVFVPYKEIVKVIKSGRLALQARAAIEEKVRQKLAEAKTFNEEERKLRDEKRKEGMIGITEEEEKAMSDAALLQKVSKVEILKKLPIEKRMFLERYPPEEGWGIEKYQKLRTRLLAGRQDIRKREITKKDGTKTVIIQHDNATAGLSDTDRFFVDEFDNWFTALELYKQLEKAIVEELRKTAIDENAKKKAELAKKKQEGDGASTPANEDKDAKAKGTASSHRAPEAPPLSAADEQELLRTATRNILYGQTAEVKVQAAASLGSLKEKAAESTRPLSLGLRDSSPEVRRAAIQALGQIATPAEYITELLGNALETGDVMMRREAALALANVDSAKVLNIYSTLSSAAVDEDGKVRWNTMRLLEKLGAKKAAPLVRGRLHDKELSVQISAACALLGIEGRAVAPDVEDIIISGLLHSDSSCRLLAVGKMPNLPATPTLIAKVTKTISEINEPEMRSLLEPIVENWKKELEKSPTETPETLTPETLTPETFGESGE